MLGGFKGIVNSDKTSPSSCCVSALSPVLPDCANIRVVWVSGTHFSGEEVRRGEMA